LGRRAISADEQEGQSCASKGSFLYVSIPQPACSSCALAKVCPDVTNCSPSSSLISSVPSTFSLLFSPPFQLYSPKEARFLTKASSSPALFLLSFTRPVWDPACHPAHFISIVILILDSGTRYTSFSTTPLLARSHRLPTSFATIEYDSHRRD